MTKFEQISIASRTFSLAALLGLSTVFDGSLAARIVLVIAIVGAMASYIALTTTLETTWVITAEMLLVGLVIGLSLPQSLLLLPYPVVLALLAGLAGGWRGAALLLTAEIAAVVLVPMAATGFSQVDPSTRLLAPWLSTTMVVGALGAGVRQLGLSPAAAESNDSYVSARRLLGNLHTVARRLPDGLDAHVIATQVLAEVRTALNAPAAGLFTFAESERANPLAHSGQRASELLTPDDAAVTTAWSTSEPAGQPVAAADLPPRYHQALPLRYGGRTVGVLALALPSQPSADALTQVMRLLDDYALKLETALLFDAIKTSATIDERQRLAREIHDGVAQEVASLGYVVDEALEMSESAVQAALLRSLRSEVTRVVSELRHSIFDLRSGSTESSSLGIALSDYLAQIGRRTGMTIHLTVDEAPARLPMAVETELFRIAQEAITNARKHSAADNLWVDVWIHPPSARIVVRDDGSGGGRVRPDSFGMTIMSERAKRIDARLSVGAGTEDGVGTSVTLDLGLLDHKSRSDLS